MQVKRYKNRKLYNLNTHKYITLKEILDAYLDDSSAVSVIKYDGTDVTEKTVLMAVLDSNDAELIKSCVAGV